MAPSAEQASPIKRTQKLCCESLLGSLVSVIEVRGTVGFGKQRVLICKRGSDHISKAEACARASKRVQSPRWQRQRQRQRTGRESLAAVQSIPLQRPVAVQVPCLLVVEQRAKAGLHLRVGVRLQCGTFTKGRVLHTLHLHGDPVVVEAPNANCNDNRTCISPSTALCTVPPTLCLWQQQPRREPLCNVHQLGNVIFSLCNIEFKQACCVQRMTAARSHPGAFHHPPFHLTGWCLVPLITHP